MELASVTGHGRVQIAVELWIEQLAEEDIAAIGWRCHCSRTLEPSAEALQQEADSDGSIQTGGMVHSGLHSHGSKHVSQDDSELAVIYIAAARHTLSSGIQEEGDHSDDGLKDR